MVARHELRAAFEQATPDERPEALRFVCQHDLAMFCGTYYESRFSAPFNAMHWEFLDAEKVPWHERAKQQRIATAAPRGGAKSTIESFATLVHDAVHGLELYIAILSTTFELAEDLVKDLHKTFTDSELHADLHADYGPFRVAGTQTDFVVHVPGQDPRGTRIKAFSFKGSIRGTKHVGVRPTKVVMDDCEHPEHVRSPDQRVHQWNYLTKDVLKAGDKFTLFRVLGTVMHAESMLARLLVAPGWRSSLWRSMIAWPTRMDLWADCRRLWADLTDDDRTDSAARYYLRHKAEMDAGSEVLWPENESLWELMVLLWSDGRASFESEKMNNARDPTRQIFDVDGFARCKFDGKTITNAAGRKISLNSCSLAVWLDPAIGEQVGNDYSSIAVIARDQFGYRYVLKCSLHKEAPSKQRARMWSMFAMFGPRCTYGVEDNGFQAMYGEGFERERTERMESGVAWNMAIKGHTSTKNKAERISRLEPDAVNGWVQFADDLPEEVMGMFRDFPSGTHDDAPDAIERADYLLGEHMPEMQTASYQ